MKNEITRADLHLLALYIARITRYTERDKRLKKPPKVIDGDTVTIAGETITIREPQK
jgi:hypothetical protein